MAETATSLFPSLQSAAKVAPITGTLTLPEPQQPSLEAQGYVKTIVNGQIVYVPASKVGAYASGGVANPKYSYIPSENELPAPLPGHHMPPYLGKTPSTTTVDIKGNPTTLSTSTQVVTTPTGTKYVQAIQPQKVAIEGVVYSVQSMQVNQGEKIPGTQEIAKESGTYLVTTPVSGQELTKEIKINDILSPSTSIFAETSGVSAQAPVQTLKVATVIGNDGVARPVGFKTPEGTTATTTTADGITFSIDSTGAISAVAGTQKEAVATTAPELMKQLNENVSTISKAYAAGTLPEAFYNAINQYQVSAPVKAIAPTAVNQPSQLVGSPILPSNAEYAAALKSMMQEQPAVATPSPTSPIPSIGSEPIYTGLSQPGYAPIPTTPIQQIPYVAALENAAIRAERAYPRPEFIQRQLNMQLNPYADVLAAQLGGAAYAIDEAGRAILPISIGDFPLSSLATGLVTAPLSAAAGYTSSTPTSELQDIGNLGILGLTALGAGEIAGGSKVISSGIKGISGIGERGLGAIGKRIGSETVGEGIGRLIGTSAATGTLGAGYTNLASLGQQGTLATPEQTAEAFALGAILPPVIEGGRSVIQNIQKVARPAYYSTFRPETDVYSYTSPELRMEELANLNPKIAPIPLSKAALARLSPEEISSIYLSNQEPFNSVYYASEPYLPRSRYLENLESLTSEERRNLILSNPEYFRSIYEGITNPKALSYVRSNQRFGEAVLPRQDVLFKGFSQPSESGGIIRPSAEVTREFAEATKVPGAEAVSVSTPGGVSEQIRATGGFTAKQVPGGKGYKAAFPSSYYNAVPTLIYDETGLPRIVMRQYGGYALGKEGAESSIGPREINPFKYVTTQAKAVSTEGLIDNYARTTGTKGTLARLRGDMGTLMPQAERLQNLVYESDQAAAKGDLITQTAKLTEAQQYLEAHPELKELINYYNSASTASIAEGSMIQGPMGSSTKSSETEIVAGQGAEFEAAQRKPTSITQVTVPNKGLFRGVPLLERMFPNVIVGENYAGEFRPVFLELTPEGNLKNPVSGTVIQKSGAPLPLNEVTFSPTQIAETMRAFTPQAQEPGIARTFETPSEYQYAPSQAASEYAMPSSYASGAYASPSSYYGYKPSYAGYASAYPSYAAYAYPSSAQSYYAPSSYGAPYASTYPSYRSYAYQPSYRPSYYNATYGYNEPYYGAYNTPSYYGGYGSYATPPFYPNLLPGFTQKKPTKNPPQKQVITKETMRYMPSLIAELTGYTLPSTSPEAERLLKGQETAEGVIIRPIIEKEKVKV